MKDGWVHWRDALVLLRLEADTRMQENAAAMERMKHNAEAMGVDATATSSSPSSKPNDTPLTEESFHAFRREFLIGLLHRVEQQAPSTYSSTPPSSPTSPSSNSSINGGAPSLSMTGVAAHNPLLHINLCHVIDLIEQQIYFDANARMKHVKFSLVRMESNDNAGTEDEETKADEYDEKWGRAELTTRSMPSTSSASTVTNNGGGDAWVLMDDEEPSAQGGSDSSRSTRARDPFSSAPQSAQPFFRVEWPLVREMLHCLVQLRCSLQPMRVPESSNNRGLAGAASLLAAALSGGDGPENVRSLQLAPPPDVEALSTTSDGSSAASESAELRPGSPLRVIIRLLLDCCSAFSLSLIESERQANDGERQSNGTASPSSAESDLVQLQDIVSSLAALVHVELSVATYVSSSGAKSSEKSGHREWKNRYVLLILWRLCQLIHVLPAPPSSHDSSGESGAPSSSPSRSAVYQLRRMLQATVSQLVESLRPFAAVHASQFDMHGTPAVSSNAAMTIDPTSVIYVPLVVNDVQFIDVDPTFDLGLVARAPPPNRNSPNGGTSRPASPMQQEDGPMSAEPRSPSSSPLYPRVMRACNEYVSSCVHLFQMLQNQFHADAASEWEDVERGVRRRVRESSLAESIGERTIEVQQAASRVMSAHAYTESNRRAVTDSLYTESLSRVADAWRKLTTELYAESSVWAPSDISSRRKLYKIDPSEDGYRMRRKITVDPDAPDHHQASQSYIDRMRAVHVQREKHEAHQRALLQQQQRRQEQHRKDKALTPTRRRSSDTHPAASTLHPSSSTPSFSRSASPVSRSHNASPQSDAHLSAVSGPSPSPPATSSSSSDTADPNGEHDPVAKLSELGRQLSINKDIGATGEEEDVDVDETEQEEKDRAASTSPPPATSDPSASSSASGATTTEEPIADKDKSSEDWDLCEVPSNQMPSASPTAPSVCPSFASSSARHIYTSPLVTLVLPIGTVYGTLELTTEHVKFSFNPNAEQQLLQQTIIQNEQLMKEAAAASGDAEDARKASMPPPSKSKPFTLPSLDQQRIQARHDRIWPLSTLVAVYRRRYQLQRTSLEFFLLNGQNVFLDFGTRNERRNVLKKILDLRPPRLIRLCSRSVQELLAKSKLTEKWRNRELSNFEYLMHLNTVSGRTYQDLSQYPVFPWILSYYPEMKVNLVPTRKESSASSGGDGSSSSGSGAIPTYRAVEVPPSEADGEIEDIEAVIRAGPSHPDTPHIFRDLTKPMGAINPERLEQVLERFHSFSDPNIPSFHYGSHYSNAGIVLFYLMRLEPFSSLHVELQSGRFDIADRLLSSIPQTWKNCCTSLSCYKELVPEFFYMAEVLENVNQYDLGVKQDGQRVDGVELPTWAKDSPAEFIRIHRAALESEYVSENLHHWIDLIWGYKQKGPAARDANNLFFHLTYEGAVDLSSIKDPVVLDAVKEQIAQFGQTPTQLFRKPHPARQPLAAIRAQRLALHSSFSQLLTQTDFHHPALRRAMVSKEMAVLHIKPLDGKLVTLSASNVVGLHLWLPDTSSEVEDAPSVGSRNHVSQMRRSPLPFTHALAATHAYPKANPITPASCAFTGDGRLLLQGNVWDHSLRVYQASSTVTLDSHTLKQRDRLITPTASGEFKLQLSQNLTQHRDRVTCITIGRDEQTLVTASKDCTLLVWKLDVSQSSSRVSNIFRSGQPFVRPSPRHILRGHEDPILAAAIESELDVCVSISTRGTVLVHSMRTGSFIQRLIVPRAAEVQRIPIEAHAKALANATAAALTALHGPEAMQHATPNVSEGKFIGVSSSPSPSPFDSVLSRARSSSSSHTHGHQIEAGQASGQLHLPKLVSFAADGYMVFYSVIWDPNTRRMCEPQLSCCNINGRHWRAVSLDEYVLSMAISPDGKLIATGSEDGMLVLRRLHDLKVVQRFEPVLSSITAIAFSLEMEYLIIGTSSGHITFFAVEAGRE